MEPLFIMHTPEIWMLLASLFPCVFIPMFFLSRRIPSLAPEGHTETKWIDGLRGVAASFVALNHTPFVLANLVIMPKVFYLDTGDSKTPVLFGALGVQLFFCITGLLFTSKILSKKPVDWTDFYAKRVRRIVPAFLVAATVALAIAAWFSWPIKQAPAEIIMSLPGIFGFGLLAIPTINEFNFVRLIGVAWTLAIEWRFYFVLPILYIAAKKSTRATLGAIILFAVIDLWLTGLSTWSFFIPGAVSFFIVSKQFSKQIRTIAALVAIAALVFMFYRAGLKTTYGLEQWINVSILFIALAISRPGILSARTFIAMGSVSYSFYLLHSMILFLVFGAAHFYVGDMGSLSIINFAIFAGLTLCFASIVSTASYIFIEKRYMHKPGAAQPQVLQGNVQPALP
ncbi:acyltransferase family protein [Pseudomonas sp. 18173]|uniref:acyltransferase family protein n=1 Tax=Pseudomonas sp. 18173 TaxID=3390055 RepID=UPI003D235A5A